jgi:hypothetical protein
MRFSLPLAAALFGSCFVPLAASSAPLPVSRVLTAQGGELSPVLRVQGPPGQPGAVVGGGQPRGGGGQRHGGGGGGYRGGHGHGGGGYRGGHGYGGGDDGGAVAAGVIGGLLLGAIIANEAQRGQSANYCAQRYRSYDWRSGTFVGRDGRRYRCP